MRRWDEVIFRDELIARDRDEPGLSVIFLLSRDAPRRPQDFGRRLDATALRDGLTALGAPPQTTYVCGNNRFVETAAGHAVDLGLAPGAIRTERFGG